MKKVQLCIPFISFLAFCNNHGEVATAPKKDTVVVAKKDFSGIAFCNTKDPVCGMPMKHDIGDTAFYKGKFISFCSDGCKAEFIKNPKGYEVK